MKKSIYWIAIFCMFQSVCLGMGPDPDEMERPRPKPLRKLSLNKEERKVEVFVTSWCHYCKKLERFLKEEGIDYSRYDIEANEGNYQMFQSIGGGGVPATRIGTEIVRGYDPEQILEILSKP